MPGPWLSWTRTLSCKSDSSKDVVYDPSVARHAHHHKSSSKIQPAPVLNPIYNSCAASGSSSASATGSKFHGKPPQQSGTPTLRSSCNCSLANLRDVVHGNTRVVHRASSSGSPSSHKDSADFLHEVSQDALFLEGEDSPSPTQELPLITVRGASASTTTTTTNSHGPHTVLVQRKKFGGSCNGCNVLETMDSMVSFKDVSSSAANMLSRNCNFPQLSCQKCGDSFSRLDALEHHHTIQHAVSELGRGDSSRNIIEIIFRSSWMSMGATPSGGGGSIGRIERVLKVHSSQRTISRFEDYRDMVKYKANSMARKNARCIADGNELLRFYGTTVACPLGAHGSTSICNLPHCGICKIIRSGLSLKNPSRGICTTATSSSAHNNGEQESGPNTGKRAMVVCRVIAGRSYRWSGSAGSNGGGDVSGAPNGYDSVVSGIGSEGGNLVVFNPRAVLPCFVVIYRC